MFVYTAFDAQGRRLNESLEAETLSAAQQELMRRGLLVLEVRPGQGRRRTARGAGSGRATVVGAAGARAGARTSELSLFCRQMTMMLRAGASVVPAIQSINEQPGRAAWHALLADVAEQVEGGSTLHDAMLRHPKAFPGVVRSIIGAGEATGAIADAFERLMGLLEARQRLRKKVISALVYPAILLLMAVNVVASMTLFVLPRFASLFEMLDTPLPTSTRLMLDAAEWLKAWWLPALGIPAAAAAGLVAWVLSDSGRRTLGRLILAVPFVGRAAAGVMLSRILHILAALLRSRVSVLEAIEQSREATGNVVFRRLIDDINQAVTEGRSISGVLRRCRHVPAPIVAAIATGEESGRLGESIGFVANWLDEENGALIGALTRALEPAILIVMGVVVGAVAISLFLPLFDVATAAG